MLKRWSLGPLGWIVLLAILLRAAFFVGLVAGDPQDDVVYYGNAFSLFNDGPRYLERFRNLPADFLANPIDQFHMRPMVTYPIAASFALFGPGEMAAVFWGYLCSILSVLVVYRLAFVLHGRSVGLVAALLYTFYPLGVINGTRILSDVQLGLFSSLGLLMLSRPRSAAAPASTPCLARRRPVLTSPTLEASSCCSRS
jgi:4-amino-4-deoxy-L-arabinose transferase-like glycosyltransferase